MRYISLLFILLLSACSGDEPEALKKPDDLIPEEKMVLVLTDVHMLEGALAVRSNSASEMRNPVNPMNLRKDPSVVPLPINPKNALQYYDIFKKHEVTREQYEKTMSWYTSNPDQLNEIYDKVLVELTRRQSEEQSKK